MTEQTDVTPAFFRLFDGVVDAYLIGDADDSLIFANRGARQLLRTVGPKPGQDIPAMFDNPEKLKGLLTTSDIVQFLTDQFPEDTVNLPPRLRQQYHSPDGA